ncbi:carbohydrate ABC transporter permease [Candidatus Xianfuyuplasma coldseepsis]|uniref:Sugar ABC transporter permease n=1 Tax=Candidatus Xianfuyuplasma coldseepsis TaxID=2782163 RepID=A0A7L7KP02_9MOLU|nr:sugar ABC transporter permease [Xianfuyuplasma coldseepsis]QMS84433.1 sugar ABC transporter permease [Xianfuyuplasma coldseepsis]
MSNVKLIDRLAKWLHLSDRAKDRLSSWLLILPYVFIFAGFIIIPILIAFSLSFTYYDAINPPEFAGMQNYVFMVTGDEQFVKNIIPNTLKYALIVGPGGFALSFFMAWMLSQIQATPRKYLSLLLYAPSMVGAILVTILWRSLFNGSESGYINAFLLDNDFIEAPIQFLQSPEYLLNIMIIVSLWSSMGIGFLAMLAGILNVNPELYEAGRIDGIKNRFQEIFYITIPSMKPQMLFGAVMAVVGAFNMGEIGVLLSGVNPTPQYSGSLIVNHVADYGFLRYEMGYASALSVVLFIVVYAFSRFGHLLFGSDD